MLVSKAPEVADEQMVNWVGLSKYSTCMISKYSKAQFLHLRWQSGFSVISQESVVDNNCFFSSMHRMSKTTVYHLQPKGGLELVSKEEKICHQLHRVSFENVGQFHQSLKAHVQLNCYTFLRARFSFYTTVCPRRRKWPAWYFLSDITFKN